MQKSHTYIYALIDPTTQYVRYIGKANDLQVRLRRHLSKTELKPKSHKVFWIKSLIEKGLKPEIIMLEKVNYTEWQQSECKWIAHYRGLPDYPTLTNGTLGGDGVDRGFKHTLETRQKMSTSRKGRKVTEETKNKLRISHLGKKQTIQTRQKNSESHKRWWQGNLTSVKERMLAPLNHGWSKETREKISVSNHNRRKRKSSTSQYKGVSWFKRDHCWRAWTMFEGKQKHLGYFKEEKEAALAYDRKIVELYGVDACLLLNFPNEEVGIGG